MKKWYALALSIIVFFGMQLLASSSLWQPAPATAQAAAPNCSLIGNNLAVQFGRPNANYNEAQYTLALLERVEDQPAIIDAINQSTRTVIIRLGASKDAPGPRSSVYAQMLNEIGAAVAANGKSFIATAGHNEPNCAEYIPLEDEKKYMQEVLDGVTASNVTLITGQIDFYCGDQPGASIDEYISQLTSLTGAGGQSIKGLALPFYITAGTPTANATVELFTKHYNQTNLDVYVTESGPLLTGSMEEFVNGVPQIVSLPRVRAFLLFNALGQNTDINFRYTRPFWNPACRQAFRSSCQDPATVLAACGVDSDPDDYYLYPIGGLADRNTDAIMQDLINQGYQPHCSTPKFDIKVVPGGDIGKLEELIARGQEGLVYRELESSLIYDVAPTQVPVLRDNNPISALFNSLEDYWGYQHHPTTSVMTPQDMIASSPIYSRLSLNQQCEFKIKLLETVEDMCERLEDPSKCALYQPIPLTDYTTQTLLDDFRSSGLTCQQITQGQVNEAQRPIVNGIKAAPLYLEKAYRLAFLVVTAELKDNGLAAFFNFLRRPGNTASPRDEVRVVAFKIPDVGTNKAMGTLRYQDPLQLTRDTLLSYEQIQKNNELGEEVKEKLRTGGAAPAIECGGEACADPLTQALIRIVNNNGVACESNPQDLPYEDSNTISTPGQISSGPGTQFSDGSDPAKDLFTAPESSITNPQRGVFDFLSEIRLGAKGDNQSKIKAYLVYPMGHELETIEQSLMTMFDTEWNDSLSSNPAVRDYFKIRDLDYGMDGGKVSFPFRDLQEPCRIDELSGREICGGYTAEAEFQVEQNDREPRILGGRLGYLTRAIQLNVNKLNSRVHEYVKSCTTTEDFLLGRCGGGSITPGETEFGDPGTRYGNGTCEPVPEGPCSIANLSQYFTSPPPGKTTLEMATKASMICNRESAGNSQARNLGCTTGRSLDYSIGLFQVNALVHCPGAFSSFSRNPISCTVADQVILQTCVNNLLDPDKNIQEMLRIYRERGNWSAWSAAPVCGIND